jgi:hypothetical protein
MSSRRVKSTLAHPVGVSDIDNNNSNSDNNHSGMGADSDNNNNSNNSHTINVNNNNNNSANSISVVNNPDHIINTANHRVVHNNSASLNTSINMPSGDMQQMIAVLLAQNATMNAQIQQLLANNKSDNVSANKSQSTPRLCVRLLRSIVSQCHRLMLRVGVFMSMKMILCA